MKRICLFTVLMIVGLMLVGCSSKNTEVSQAQMIQTPAIELTNTKAAIYFEGELRKSTVPWDPKMVATIEQSRSTIAALGLYLKDKLNFNSEIPFYTYKASYEFLLNQFNKLQGALDERVAIEGAISEGGVVVYGYIKKEAVALLTAQRLKIAATEKAAEDKAGENSITELKNIFSTISPLLQLDNLGLEGIL